MSALLTLTQAAPLLACRDRRTALRRLAALGVPVLELGGRLFVDEVELERAIRARARPLAAPTDATPTGVQLAPGARLWDAPATHKVGRRRATAPARGDRG